MGAADALFSSKTSVDSQVENTINANPSIF